MKINSRYYIYGALALLALALSALAAVFGKVVEESRELERSAVLVAASSSRLQQAAQSVNEAAASAETSSSQARTVARNPDGTVALDGAGQPIYETRTESASRSASSSRNEAASTTTAASSATAASSLQEHEKEHRIEKPAVKRWLLLADYEPASGTTSLGAGFRQSFGLVEAGAWVSNPAPLAGAPTFRPRLGLSLAF